MEKEKTIIRYRVEWKHNYQWRMDFGHKLTFLTRKEAEKAASDLRKEYDGRLEVRVLKVQS